MYQLFYFILMLGLLFAKSLKAQDDLMSMLNEESKQKSFTYASFKGTRLINMHTLETTGRRALDFRISHRFGTLNSGAYQAFGVDLAANIRLGLEYSYDGRLQFGIGRTSHQKVADGFVKYRVLRQTTDNKNPVSITWLSCAFYTFEKRQALGINYYSNPVERLSYTHQLIVGRKFNEHISFQIAPTWVHFNLVENLGDKNDIYAIASLGRVKLTKRFALTAEYGYRLNKYYNPAKNTFYDTFAVGCDIETGGHVFQLHFVNSIGLVESQFIPYTNTNWRTGGIRLGFNISRIFAI